MSIATKKIPNRNYHRRVNMLKGKDDDGFGFGLGKMKKLTDAFKKAQEVQIDF